MTEMDDRITQAEAEVEAARQQWLAERRHGHPWQADILWRLYVDDTDTRLVPLVQERMARRKRKGAAS